jgi:hypothetical protein
MMTYDPDQRRSRRFCTQRPPLTEDTLPAQDLRDYVTPYVRSFTIPVDSLRLTIGEIAETLGLGPIVA